MKLEGKAQVLKIYIGSIDKHNHQPMYESIVMSAKNFGILGATVYRAVLSFGASSTIHSAKIFELSLDLPIIIEKIKIKINIEHLTELFEDDNFGGLITTYEVDIVQHKAHKIK